MLDQNLECWSGVVEMEKLKVSWVNTAVSVDMVVSEDTDDVADMAEWVVEERWVERVEKVVSMSNCLVGQVESSYVPSHIRSRLARWPLRYILRS